MKKSLAFLLMLISWATIIAQLVLMIQNKVAPIGETVIRFFSFFTILTNILVAVYYTSIALIKSEHKSFFLRPGVLTAITVFISVVSIVYQVVLRPLWHPVGLQKLVDELLHTIIPICTAIFWMIYEARVKIMYSRIPIWLIYPLLYLIFILIRGNFSGYYPYPFIDAGKLDLNTILLNSLYMLIAFTIISSLYIFIHNLKVKR